MSKVNYDYMNVCLTCGKRVNTKTLIENGDYDNWASYGTCPTCFKLGNFPVVESKKESKRKKREMKKEENLLYE